MVASHLLSFLAAAAVGIASGQQQPMTCGPHVNVCGVMTLGGRKGFLAPDSDVVCMLPELHGSNSGHAVRRMVVGRRRHLPPILKGWQYREG